ncbi:eukaryotic translation initiation factor 3 subunit D [Paraphysoderma sedebokerense]|nr:eukaryotic translation initiation factor 3 subunit D [Paraphysoderma sedebokerense]
MSSKPRFTIPTVDATPSWGPKTDEVAYLGDIPYAPFSKSDNLGRAADWTVEDRKDHSKGGRRDRYGRGETSTTTMFSYQHGEDESSFSLVDASGKAAAAASVVVSGMKKGQTQGRRNVNQRVQRNQPRGRGGHGGYRGRMQNRGGAGGRNTVTRESSIQIGMDWKVIQEIDLSKLTKLYTDIPQAEDLSSHGVVYFYNKTYDRVNTRSEKPLIASDRMKYFLSTSLDPVLTKYSKQLPETSVFATDAVLSLLMTCPRSVYSWDIIVTRTGNQVFLDKRGNFEYLTVNENAYEPPAESSDKDNINSHHSLGLEATYINTNFSQQIVDFDEPLSFPEPNPFATSPDVQLQSVGYRYRKWDLGNNVVLVARTEVDSVVKTSSGGHSFMTAKALNEFDPRAPGAGGALDWRQKLDSQRGAVLATEMRNNGFKLARWTVQTMLAGADIMKLGFVSRVNFRELSRHSILGTQSMKPQDLATQMNLSFNNAWGILRALVDECLKLDEGKYIFVKDPNKPLIRLYSVPPDSFENLDETRSVAEGQDNTEEADGDVVGK